MAVVWTFLHGAPTYKFGDIQGGMLSEKTLLGATTTRLTYDSVIGVNNTGTVRFEGAITLDGGNNPVGGTINTLKFYAPDSTLVAKATGYSIDVADLLFALDHLDVFASQYEALLAGQPITMNGSDERDVFYDPDYWAGPAKGANFFGNGGDDTLNGGRGGDTLHGGPGLDRLYGDEGNDKLFGDSGHDELFGFRGNDTLTGGAKGDKFIISGELNATTNVDTFADFTEADRIILYNTFCPGIGDAGILDDGRLRLGTKAKDPSDRVIYDPDTGKLFYDEDGKGSAHQILFAKMQKHFTLDATDFEIIVF